MHEVTIHGISPELFDKLKETVFGHFEATTLAHDLELQVHGVRSNYSYDAGANALTVSIVHVPAIVTKGFVLGQLYDTLGKLAIKKPVTLPA